METPIFSNGCKDVGYYPELGKENRLLPREPQDVEQWVAALRQFQGKDAFLEQIRHFDDVADERFFNDSQYQKVREAWIAGHFAGALERSGHNVRVCLVGALERFPDFQIQFDGAVQAFEVATSFKPNRKLGREYKLRAVEQWLFTPFRPALGEKRGPCWVAVQIHRKARKHYDGHPHLLVYANFEANALDLGRIAEYSRDSLGAFSSVWVLWSGRVGKVHDTGAFPQPLYEWIE